MLRETDLYEPVKRFLEADGYEVKAEVDSCDVVAVREGEPTLVVELKLTFSLELILQGIDRQKLSDNVYLAIPAPDTPGKRKNWRARQRKLINLCRRLGLGLMLVREPAKRGRPVDILLDPAPYTPRKNSRRQSRLKKEFLARDGDPNTGGLAKGKRVTAYRQDALRCAALLGQSDQMKVSEIRATTGVEKAASILQKNFYGWFERVERGQYALTETGKAALTTWSAALESLEFRKD